VVQPMNISNVLQHEAFNYLGAIRGATQLASDTQENMDEAVAELMSSILNENGLVIESVVSAILTSTPDLLSAFPASSARRCGWSEVPLICAQEIDVVGAMPRVVRVLVHAYVPDRARVTHVYLRGTQELRKD
jgi:chorismate mutase